MIGLAFSRLWGTAEDGFGADASQAAPPGLLEQLVQCGRTQAAPRRKGKQQRALAKAQMAGWEYWASFDAAATAVREGGVECSCKGSARHPRAHSLQLRRAACTEPVCVWGYCCFPGRR